MVDLKKTALHYQNYLKLDKILQAQFPMSKELGDESHDEMLFIIIHQVYELWFKQIIHELKSVKDTIKDEKIDEKEIIKVVKRTDRIKEILNLLVKQIDVLETMYKRITKPFKKDNIPTLELKIPYQRKQYQCSFYDTNNQVISIDKLIPGSEIITIVDIKGLKFLKKNYYCDICISQIKLCYQETFPVFDKCLIVDDETQNYDYEIIDEQVIQNHKEKILLSEKIDKLSKQIDSEQSELEDLKNKLKDLK